MPRSLTHALLEALALPAPDALAELRASVHGTFRWSSRDDGHADGPRWSAWSLPRTPLREAIAVERGVRWYLSDDCEQSWLVRQRTDHGDKARALLDLVRKLLVALDQPPCTTCLGAGTVFCESCGSTGEGDEPDEKCNVCSGEAVVDCKDCEAISLVPDHHVLMLWQAEVIARARLAAAKKRLEAAQEEHATRHRENEGAYATFRRAEKAAGVEVVVHK